MTRTGTQNRPYDAAVRLIVDVTFTEPSGLQRGLRFDWNNREAVRRFAAEADSLVRAGGKVATCQAPEYVQKEYNAHSPVRAPASDR